MRLCMHARTHVALFTHHAMRMLLIEMSFLAPFHPKYFSTVSHKRHDFRGKCIRHKMCAFTFYTTFVSDFAHYKKNLTRYFQKREQVLV